MRYIEPLFLLIFTVATLVVAANTVVSINRTITPDAIERIWDK